MNSTEADMNQSTYLHHQSPNEEVFSVSDHSDDDSTAAVARSEDENSSSFMPMVKEEVSSSIPEVDVASSIDKTDHSGVASSIDKTDHSGSGNHSNRSGRTSSTMTPSLSSTGEVQTIAADGTKNDDSINARIQSERMAKAKKYNWDRQSSKSRSPTRTVNMATGHIMSPRTPPPPTEAMSPSGSQRGKDRWAKLREAMNDSSNKPRDTISQSPDVSSKRRGMVAGRNPHHVSTRPGAVSVDQAASPTPRNAKEYLRESVRNNNNTTSPTTRNQQQQQQHPSFRKMSPRMESKNRRNIPDAARTLSPPQASSKRGPGAFAENSPVPINTKERMVSTSNMLLRNQQHAASKKEVLSPTSRQEESETSSDDGPELMNADDDDDDDEEDYTTIEAPLQRNTRRVTANTVRRSQSERNHIAPRMAPPGSTLIRAASAMHPGSAATAAGGRTTLSHSSFLRPNAAAASIGSSSSPFVGDNPNFRAPPSRNIASRQNRLPTNREDSDESLWSQDSSLSLKPGVVAVDAAGEEAFYGSPRSKGEFTMLQSSQAMNAHVQTRSDDLLQQQRSQNQVGVQALPFSDAEEPTAYPAGNDNAEAIGAGKESDAFCVLSKAKLIALIVLIIVIVVGATTGVILSQQQSSPLPSSSTTNPSEPPKPTNAPTAAPTGEDRFNELFEILAPLSGEAVLQNSTSPQHKALKWLSFEDSDQIEPSEIGELVPRYLLAVLYYSMAGDNWFDSSNFLVPGAFCDWKGITCNDTSSGPEVLSIQLERNNLKGSIPSEISNFSSLQRLILSDNQVHGQLPSELGRCTNLFEIGLGRNGLSSTLPTEIGALTNLVEIGLEDNRIEGELPTSIGKLSNVATLGLSRNSFTGTLPTELGRLTQLEHLYMSTCRLEGFPSQLENASNLRTLELGDNLFQGAIPDWISNLSQLVELKLDFNQFSSSIPTQLGDLTNLATLWLNDNDLTGQIPSQLINLVNLADAQFHETELSGDLNSIFCKPENSMSTLTADCGGVDPSVNCTCCTLCL